MGCVWSLDSIRYSIYSILVTMTNHLEGQSFYSSTYTSLTSALGSLKTAIIYSSEDHPKIFVYHVSRADHIGRVITTNVVVLFLLQA